MASLNRIFKRKGWWLLTVIVIFFIGGSWGIRQQYYSGKTYYTQIITTGQKRVAKDSEGQKHISYQYKQLAYDAQGKAKKVNFNGVKPTPLAHAAYLALKVSPIKGVVAWQKVTPDEVPQPALKQLKATNSK